VGRRGNHLVRKQDKSWASSEKTEKKANAYSCPSSDNKEERKSQRTGSKARQKVKEKKPRCQEESTKEKKRKAYVPKIKRGKRDQPSYRQRKGGTAEKPQMTSKTGGIHLRRKLIN